MTLPTEVQLAEADLLAELTCFVATVKQRSFREDFTLTRRLVRQLRNKLRDPRRLLTIQPSEDPWPNLTR